MAMGKKRTRDRQVSMWVATADLPKSAGHPFYARLNRVLDDAGFDTFVEAQCAQFYADGIGRPSLAPGRYFRLLLLGYFEGVDSERAMAWRAADSLSIRQFLDVALYEAPPDHSTLSRTRRLIDVETHHAVFTWDYRYRASAQKFLTRWMTSALRSRLPTLRTFVGTLRTHLPHILAFIDRPLTNAVGEGLNRIVKLVKNRASGYRHLDYLTDMIYLTVGDLDIPAHIPSQLRTL